MTQIAPMPRKPRTLDLDDAPAPAPFVSPFAQVSAPATMPVRKLALDPIPVPAPIVVAPEPVKAGEIDTAARARIVETRALLEAGGLALPTDALFFAEGTALMDAGRDTFEQKRLAFEKMPHTADEMAALAGIIGAEDRTDAIVSVPSLTMTPSGGIVLSGVAHGYSRASFGDVCRWGGFGRGSAYLFDDCSPSLRAVNFNEQVSGREGSFKARTRLGASGEGRDIFAGVGESYADYDADKVARAIAKHAPKGSRATFHYDRASASGYVDVLFFTPVDASSVAVGEVFLFGVRVPFNDAGKGSIDPMILAERIRCINCTTVAAQMVGLGKAVRHVGDVGARVEALLGAMSSSDHWIGQYVERWGYALNDELVAAPVTKLVGVGQRKLKGKETFKAFGECDTNERVAGFVRGLGVTGAIPVLDEAQTAEVVRCYWRDEVTATERVTRAGLTNALTLYAHTGADRWTAAALEEAGGTLTWGRAPVAFQYVHALAA